MKIGIYNPFINNKTAMNYGLGSYLKMLKKALDYAGVPYKILQSKEDGKDCDIIHALDIYDLNTAKYFKKMGKRLIVHYHTPYIPITFNSIAKHADLVVFVSERQKQYFKYPEGIVLYNAIIPERQIHATRTYDFVFTSRQDMLKGINWIQQQIAIHPEFSWVTTGDVMIPGAVNLGYISWEQLMHVLASSKMHILPSYFETFGLATLYAMMQGSVPVVSKYTGVAEILDENLSIIFDPFEADVEQIWEEYESKRLDSKRKQIREYVLKFDYRWYAGKIAKVYEEVIG